MKKFIRRFLQEEEGAEIIEIVIGITIAAALVTVVIKVIMPTINQKIGDSNSAIDSINIDTGNTGQ